MVHFGSQAFDTVSRSVEVVLSLGRFTLIVTAHRYAANEDADHIHAMRDTRAEVRLDLSVSGE